MKNHLVLTLAVCVLCACQQNEELTQPSTEARQITFRCSEPDLQVVQTRASLSDASLTDLWIYEGSTLLCHQASTDSDFGSPSVSLTYGSHALTFVASSAEGQTVTNAVWSCTKMKDTFAKDSTFSVDGSTQSSVAVELRRRVAKVTFQTTDNVPTTVSKCHLKVDNQLALDKDLKGANPVVYESTLDVSSVHGSTCTVSCFVMPESASAEEDCSVMVEFLDASGTALYHYERTLKVKANRQTTLKGAYFSSGSNLVSVSTTWDTGVETPLFPTE